MVKAFADILVFLEDYLCRIDLKQDFQGSSSSHLIFENLIRPLSVLSEVGMEEFPPSTTLQVLCSLEKILTSSLFRDIKFGNSSINDLESSAAVEPVYFECFAALVHYVLSMKFISEETSGPCSNEHLHLKMISIFDACLQNVSYAVCLGDHTICQLAEFFFKCFLRYQKLEFCRIFIEQSLHRFVRQFCLLLLFKKSVVGSVNSRTHLSAGNHDFTTTSLLEILHFINRLSDPFSSDNTDRLRLLSLSLFDTFLDHLVDNIFLDDNKVLAYIMNDLIFHYFVLLFAENSQLTIAAISVTTRVLTKISLKGLKPSFVFHYGFYFELLYELLNSNHPPATNTTSSKKKQALLAKTRQIKEKILESFYFLLETPGFVEFLFMKLDCNLSMAIFPYQYLMSYSIQHLMQDDSGRIFFPCLRLLHLLLAKISNIPSDYCFPCILKTKHQYLKAIEIFNTSPAKGILFLNENNIYISSSNATIVHFLKNAPGLSKKHIGEFLSKSNNKDILELYMRDFPYKGLRIDQALRFVLESFRLPGESQLIEKIMETFSCLYFEHNKDQPVEKFPFRSADSVFTLSYSIMMLNTDLFNPNVKERISLDKYVKNISGTNENEDFPLDYIKDIYEAIQKNEIILPSENRGALGWDFRWRKMLALYKPPLTALADFSHEHVFASPPQSQLLIDLFVPFQDTLLDLFVKVVSSQVPASAFCLVGKSVSNLLKIYNDLGCSPYIVKFLENLLKRTEFLGYGFSKPSQSSESPPSQEHSLILSKATMISQAFAQKPLAFQIFIQNSRLYQEISVPLWPSVILLLKVLFLNFALPLRWLCLSAIRVEPIIIQSYFGAKMLIAAKKESAAPVGLFGKMNYLFGGYSKPESISDETPDAFLRLALLPDWIIKKLELIHNDSFITVANESLIDEFFHDWRYLKKDNLLALLNCLIDAYTKLLNTAADETSWSREKELEYLSVQAFYLELCIGLIQSNKDRLLASDLWTCEQSFVRTILKNYHHPLSKFFTLNVKETVILHLYELLKVLASVLYQSGSSPSEVNPDVLVLYESYLGPVLSVVKNLNQPEILEASIEAILSIS